MKKTSLAIAVILLLVLSGHAQNEHTDDGYYWKSLSEMQKLTFAHAYIKGYVQGWAQTVLEANKHGNKGSINSWSDPSDLTYGQFVAGIDTFYKDYRNLQIDIDSAVGYVVKAVGGASTEDLEKYQENARRIAARK